MAMSLFHYVGSIGLKKPRTFASLVKSRLGARNAVSDFRVDGMKVRMRGLSLKPQYLELFHHQSYLAPGAPKRILDLGANVGLASMFFAKHYPGAAIDAIECDPEIFELLAHNIAANGVNDVTLHNFAAFTQDGEMAFSADGHDGGQLAHDGAVKVRTVDFKAWLAERPAYDLIKMDIEGAERELFPHIADELVKAKFLILEYHSQVGEAQTVGEILTYLTDHGFRYHIQRVDHFERPLFGHPSGMDNQLNIFAYKQD